MGLSRRNSRRRNLVGSPQLSMTSMIDVVFLLLIFFLLSAKFISHEKHLASQLPRDRGPGPEFETMKPDAIIQLDWRGDEGHARAYYSGMMAPTDEPAVVFDRRRDDRVGYVSPDFEMVERWLASGADRFGRDLPVTVRTSGDVPTQMVVSVLDSCTRLRLANFALAYHEQAPN